MHSADLQKAAELLGAMRELELAIEQFYVACAAAFGAEAPFWQAIASQEHEHAETLARIVDLVAENPERYSWGRLFQLAAVATMVAGVRTNTDRLQRGELTQTAALALARDYERSILESRYEQVLQTDDAVYTSLVRKIVEDTKAHRSSIEHRVASLRKP